jgi:hypothetical protein
MKPALRSWFSDQPAGRDSIRDGQQRDGATPTLGDVLTEAGLLLAVHLASAFAVTLTLRLCGIA